MGAGWCDRGALSFLNVYICISMFNFPFESPSFLNFSWAKAERRIRSAELSKQTMTIELYQSMR